MAFSGGVFSRIYDWTDDRDASVAITASRFDTEMDGMATGLSTCVLKDGTQTITANIPFAGFRLTGIGSATARTDAARADQVQDGGMQFATATGTDTYAATLAPVITAYANGQSFRIKFTNANTTAATLNVNAVGVVDLQKRNGTALVSGDIPANSIFEVTYNSTGPKFIIDREVTAGQPLDADLTAIAAATVLRGAILRGSSAPAWEALTVGAANTVLFSDGTDAAWTTVPTAAIANNAVTGAKIAMGSDAQGDILFYDGTDYARLGPGTSGQFLKTQGAAANPIWAGAGLVPIERKTGAAVASYDFITGIGATYRTYKLIGWLQPATDDVELWLRISDDAGVSFEADASDYRHQTISYDDSSTARFRASTGDTKITLCTADATLAVGNAASERIQFEITFNNPDSAAFQKLFTVVHDYIAATGVLINSKTGGVSVATAAVNGIQLLFESGNIAAGDVTLYGVVNA